MLNKETGLHFRFEDGNLRHVRARINDGHTFKQAEMVVRCKNSVWRDDPNMSRFLRPETLFGTKFDSYLNEAVEFCDCGSCGLKISDPKWKVQHVNQDGTPMDPEAFLKERQDILAGEPHE